MDSSGLEVCLLPVLIQRDPVYVFIDQLPPMMALIVGPTQLALRASDD